MKKILIFILVFAFLLSGCGKEPEEIVPEVPEISEVSESESSKPLPEEEPKEEPVEEVPEEELENERIKALFDLTRKFNSAILVSIEVETNKDAYMLFESLNNRGIPLSAIDLIKNLLISIYIWFIKLEFTDTKARD